MTPWPTGRKHSLFRSDHVTRNALATQNNGALGRIIIVTIIIINIIIFLVLIKLYSILNQRMSIVGAPRIHVHGYLISQLVLILDPLLSCSPEMS